MNDEHRGRTLFVYSEIVYELAADDTGEKQKHYAEREITNFHWFKLRLSSFR